jgi:hypothetical protein
MSLQVLPLSIAPATLKPNASTKAVRQHNPNWPALRQSNGRARAEINTLRRLQVKRIAKHAQTAAGQLLLMSKKGTVKNKAAIQRNTLPGISRGKT